MTSAHDRDLASMQRRAADCLAAYADACGIRHPGLDELIAHLRAYPDADNPACLPAWDQAGLVLQVTGRGDPLPASLLRQIAADRHEELNDIVCSCVEVGLADLYGAATEIPEQMLARALAIQREVSRL